MQGERRSALRQMEAKFGQLSPEIKQQVEALSPESLAQLQLDLLTAKRSKNFAWKTEAQVQSLFIADYSGATPQVVGLQRGGTRGTKKGVWARARLLSALEPSPRIRCDTEVAARLRRFQGCPRIQGWIECNRESPALMRANVRDQAPSEEEHGGS